MSDPVLIVRELGFALPAEPLFANLSFGVEEGGLCLVTGGVGTGKTTLARLIGGEREPSAGTVARTKPVWLVPMAGTGLDAGLTIDQHADRGLPLATADATTARSTTAHSGSGSGPMHVRPAARAVELATELGVRSHDLGRPIEQLSFGNRQKAAMVLALLAGEGNLVVFDEPFAGVDTAALAPMVDLIDRARAEGTTIVIATSAATTALLSGSSLSGELRPSLVVDLGD